MSSFCVSWNTNGGWEHTFFAEREEALKFASELLMSGYTVRLAS